MKRIAASIAALIASGAAAHAADTFTFAGSSQVTNEVGGPVAGAPKPVGAVFSDGTSKATYASGQKTNSKVQCASWSASPASMFSGEGICMGTEGANTYTVAFSCQSMDPNTSDCWGRLTGTGGTYANRTGVVSWRGVRNGKALTSAGSGSWN